MTYTHEKKSVPQCTVYGPLLLLFIIGGDGTIGILSTNRPSIIILVTQNLNNKNSKQAKKTTLY